MSEAKKVTLDVIADLFIEKIVNRIIKKRASRRKKDVQKENFKEVCLNDETLQKVP